MTDMDQFKRTYFEECGELLGDVESTLSEMRDAGATADGLNAVFRGVHTIKGGGGAFGFEDLVTFAHGYETLLDMLRDGRVDCTTEIVDLLLRANDIVAGLVGAAESGESLGEDYGADIKSKIEAAISGDAPSDAAASQVDVPQNASSADDGGIKTYIVEFIPNLDLLQNASEPLLLIRQLGSLGEIVSEVIADKVPSLDELNPEEVFLTWRFILKSDCSEEEIREVFEFVEDDCVLKISVDSEVVPEAAEDSEPEAVESTPAADVEPKVAQVKTAPPAGQAPTKAPAVSSMRVDLDKVDRMVNMVGELVITQAMIQEQLRNSTVEMSAELERGLEDLTHHTRELQESVMAIRAQPVKSVFARMPRLVRELSETLEKEVKIVTSGEDTEVDKTVVEQLGDPLMHMIRNSVDHGIEMPDDREAAGKPREGTVHLSAEHRSGRIVISIQDDGAGINRERVLGKAREKGLIGKNDVLSDEEIDNLIFHPGFSTAQTVSNVSGRGVGMDVVKQNIRNMGGRINIDNEPGQGTKFSLSLPLTLAVLDGMVIGVGEEIYILPLTNIIETLRPVEKDVNALVGCFDVLSIRGEYVPILYVRDVFGIKNAKQDITKSLVVLVETEDSKKIGLVVDEMLGQSQVVIKSLEANYQAIHGVSGATILGSGRVALILDVIGLSDLIGSQSDQKNLEKLVVTKSKSNDDIVAEDRTQVV